MLILLEDGHIFEVVRCLVDDDHEVWDVSPELLDSRLEFVFGHLLNPVHEVSQT